MYYMVARKRGTEDVYHALEFGEATAEDIRRLPANLEFYPEVGATLEVIHRTEKGAREVAERIAREQGMPEDSYPELWDNISVHRVGSLHHRPFPAIIRD